jgi:two-component system, sensor histidine kinase YesM
VQCRSIEVKALYSLAIIEDDHLQPLVENAIHHGVARKKRKGLIEIRIDELDGQVLLCVADDGVGIEPERLEELNRSLGAREGSTEHIGIINCSRRLSIEFGSSSGLRLESVAGKGTRAIAVFSKRIDVDWRPEMSLP